MGNIVVTDLVKELISRIQNRRKYLKISQEQLAKSIGVSRFKIMRIEKGEIKITLEEYLKCCIVLDLIPFESC